MLQTARQYNVYVPLNYNDGSEVEDWKLVEVERNLFEKFRGLTCFPTNLPLRGLWTKGGLVFQDRILLYIVIDFTASEENLSFMQQYKDILKAGKMMRSLVWMSFVLIIFLLSGSSSTSYSVVNKGEKLYISHCSACHSLEGTGKGIFPSLTDSTEILGKDGLFTIIKKGREETGMPAISGLSEQDLEHIYSYLETLKKAKTEGARGLEGEGAKKTGKESVTAEEKPEKEKKKVLSVDSLRALGIPLNDRIVAPYEKARRLPALFSELPCFCGCQWINHSHLLNCFQTTHGAKCALCQEEAEVAERLHMQYQLNKLMASPETPRSLDEVEKLRKEEAEANKKIALQLVRLFWKRRAVGGLHEF